MSTINGGWRGPNIVKDGLVLYLDASSRTSYSSLFSPTTWKDISGLSNNGTLINGPTFDSANGGSIVFDGSNDNIDCGPASFLTSSLTGLTVNAWVYSTNSRIAIIAENGTNSTTNTFYLAQETVNYFTFQVCGTTTNDLVYTNFIYQTNTWYNLVGVWSPNNRVEIYSNGVLSSGLRANSAQTSLINGNRNLFLGIRPASSVPFQGRIAYFSIYNRALSATEITQNYNATRTRFGL